METVIIESKIKIGHSNLNIYDLGGKLVIAEISLMQQLFFDLVSVILVVSEF